MNIICLSELFDIMKWRLLREFIFLKNFENFHTPLRTYEITINNKPTNGIENENKTIRRFINIRETV